MAQGQPAAAAAVPRNGQGRPPASSLVGGGAGAGASSPLAPMSDQLAALRTLADLGVPQEALLRSLPSPSISSNAPAESPDRPGAVLPGVGADRLDISDSAREQFAHDVIEILDDHDRTMQPRHALEEEINSAYAMRSQQNATHMGTQPGDARLVTDLTMYVTDQQTARLSNNIRSVTPIARCTPIISASGAETAVMAAQSAEHFLDAYGSRVIQIPVKLSQAIHRTVRVGTAVLKVSWAVDRRRIAGKNVDRGRVRWDLVPNRLMKVWPPTIWDWQDDYLLVGHESFMTRGQWAAQVRRLKINSRTAADVEATAGWDRDRGLERLLSDQDVQRGAMSNRHDELIRIVELYFHGLIPGTSEVGRYHLYLSRPLQRILWLDYNRHREQDHPYFPIRYKYVDESAWGNGCGQELLYAQAGGTSMLNIRMDALQTSAYHFVVVNEDAIHQQQVSRPLMGQRVPSRDPNNDYIPRKLGGPVPELESALADNDNRGMRAAGVPPVLGGFGDPVQKSGTGTGATQALINEAGKKHGYIDQTIRDDVGPLLLFTLKLIAQAAPDGVYYEYASPDDAQKLILGTYQPPQGEMGQLFRIDVQAPNAATSREGRQQSWLLLYQFLRDHLTVWGQQAVQLLQSENPAAVSRLLHEILAFQTWLAAQLVEDYQLPGAKDLLPRLPDPVPTDEVINQLQQQVAQGQQQVQQLTQQLQQMLAAMGMGPGGAGAPGGPGGVPEGAPGAPPAAGPEAAVPPPMMQPDMPVDPAAMGSPPPQQGGMEAVQ